MLIIKSTAMGKLYDNEGNEIEAFTKEEMTEAIDKKVGETKAEYEERIKGLEDKEHNFKALRAKVEKGEKLTEKEQELLKKEEELTAKEASFQERLVDNWKEKALNEKIGDDEEKRKRVLYFYNEELKGDALTEEEIIKKVEKAVALDLINEKKPDATNQAMGVSGREPNAGKVEDFAETDEGKSILERIAPEIKEKGDKK